MAWPLSPLQEEDGRAIPYHHPAERQDRDRHPGARRGDRGLSYSNKSWHVLQVEGAKTDGTRQRRIATSVDILKQGRAR